MTTTEPFGEVRRGVFPAVFPYTMADPVTEPYWAAAREDRLSMQRCTQFGTFRMPPAPFRQKAHAKGPGHCCLCGQPVFRFGWHRDLWADGHPNRRANWHACCVAAWQFWTAPSDHVHVLRRLQKHRCAITGTRLARDAEVDHRVPLFQVWRECAPDPRAWPGLLGYWGFPNLQVINRAAHLEKCGLESSARAQLRRANLPRSERSAGETGAR